VDPKHTPWLVAIGAAFAATWVAILVAISRRAAPQMPVINIWNGGQPGQLPALPAMPELAPLPVVQTANAQTAALAGVSKMATFTLPVREGARVATAATNRHWQARIRNIGPPGSTALLADCPNNLNYPSASIAVPAGDDFEITLAPRGALFAIGDVAGVQLTVMMSELAA
jgi:hypothetical protein